jgi:hypothetical protein
LFRSAPVFAGIAVSLMVSACRSKAPPTDDTPSPVPALQSAKAASHDQDLGVSSPDELIELYVFHPDCGFRTFADPVAYHAALSRNRAITAELSRRGEAAAETCRHHLHDLRNIFDGDGGPGKNVASVCHDLLSKLGHAVGEKVEYRFCGR